MPTVADLGQKVKAKYPGQYDDLADDDLGRRIQQKYPGQYDDFSDAPSQPSVAAPGPPKPPLPAQLSRGIGLDSQLNPVDTNTGRPISRQTQGFGAPSPMVQGIEQIAGAGVRAPHEQDQRTTGQRVFGGINRVAEGAMAATAPVALPAVTATVGIPAAIIGGVTAGAAQQGVQHGLTAAGVAPEYAETAGLGAGVLAGMAAGAGAARTQQVDSHIAGLRAWGFEKDPHILDQISNGEIKLTSGLGDLKQPYSQASSGQVAAGRGGFSNETVLQALPQAKTQNRAAWRQWMSRAQGQVRTGDPIVQATANALKANISDERAQAILSEAQRQYSRPMTPSEMEAALEQKNGELASFYSSSKEVQAAAERAGADTLKTKSLLEAQAKALREMLYNTLDPEGRGAGPREIQARFGALKAIEQGANANRTDIIASHPVNPMERAANIHLDPRAMIKARQGNPEWLIDNAIKAAPNPGPLPVPTRPYPAAPLQITQGDIITPPPATPPGPPTMRNLAPHQMVNVQPRLLPAPAPGQPPLNVLPTGPAGTPRPLPPAGMSALMDQPGRPLGLPAPPAPEPRMIRAMPAPGESHPAEAIRPETAPAPGVIRNLGKTIWDALNPGGQ